MKLFILPYLVTLVGGEVSVSNVVQRTGATTTMSCLLPSVTDWKSCMFQKDDSQDCVLTADQSNQPCTFQDSHLHVTPDGLCQLVITDVQVSQNIISVVDKVGHKRIVSSEQFLSLLLLSS